MFIVHELFLCSMTKQNIKGSQYHNTSWLAPTFVSTY